MFHTIVDSEIGSIMRWFALIALFLTQGCMNHTALPKRGFELYCVNPEDVADAEALETIQLPEYPLIQFADVLSYDWSTHELNLSEEGWRRVETKITIENLGQKGLPFVVTIDLEIIYWGSFYTILFSERPSSPFVLLESIKDRRFVIQAIGNSDMIIDDLRIRAVFSDSDRLEGG
jgi:hypothetical protein